MFDLQLSSKATISVHGPLAITFANSYAGGPAASPVNDALNKIAVFAQA
jgi:hypothetical protein